ncbi:MAG: hypothetical protein JWN04_5672 [Myxococcaceae bacterium]|nr:hypothetical protein [Myxococcaceae bacterium]
MREVMRRWWCRTLVLMFGLTGCASVGDDGGTEPAVASDDAPLKLARAELRKRDTDLPDPADRRADCLEACFEGYDGTRAAAGTCVVRCTPPAPPYTCNLQDNSYDAESARLVWPPGRLPA